MTTRAKQGGFQNWQELRDHLIEQYGSTPHPATEQEIIDAYELHPDAVTKAGQDLIGAVGVTSPWGVLKSRATKIGRPPANPERNPSIEREKRIARAEQWIRAAGIHIDRPEEILDELFGDSSGSKLLREYAQVDLIRGEEGWTQTEPTGDTTLATHMLDLWAEHRHLGMQIERDAEERTTKFREHQAQIAELKAQVAAAREPVYEKPLPEYDYSADTDDDIPF